MKKSLLQKAKGRIAGVFRPMHKTRTRLKKGIAPLSQFGMGQVAPVDINSGQPIENARACRGKVGFPRISRSKYSPAV